VSIAVDKGTPINREFQVNVLPLAFDVFFAFQPAFLFMRFGK
jgi:hypothetical protein